MATDPICGMTVDPASALHADRDGARHYFCCASCRDRFLAQDPSETEGAPACHSSH